MNDGKVEVSIGKWEEVRTKNTDLKREVKDLREKQNEVKIVLVDKEINYNVKYDRWKQKNVLIDESKVIESVEYMKLDSVKKILDGEARDRVKNDLKNKDTKIKSLEKKITDGEVKHNKSLNVIKEKHKTVVDGLLRKSGKLIKEVHDLKLKSKEKELEKKNCILQDRIETLEIEIDKKNLKIEDLEKTNKALFKRIPIWRRTLKFK